MEVSESLREADFGAWRALRERDLRLKSHIRGLRGPQRARFEAQRARFEAHRSRLEASEALGEPDLRLGASFEASDGLREPHVSLRELALRPQCGL